MWERLGRAILKYRIILLLLLAGITGRLVYHASKVELSYDFSRAIPTNNPKYKAYQEFRKKFGEDGNLLVIGIQTSKLFDEKIFNSYSQLMRDLKKLNGVDDVIGVPSAINLVKQPETEKLKAVPIFPERNMTKV